MRERCLEPELLDSLSPDDPAARRARRDLSRINAVMGSAWMMSRLLKRHVHPAPRHIADLGTGDALQMLRLAKACAHAWPATEVMLIDRQPAVAQKTLQAFAALGWTASIVQDDAVDWAHGAPKVDLVLANLLLHHLTEAALRDLFADIAARSIVFAASEPRRSRSALIGSHLVGLLGCGPVARFDSVVSVRAGFSNTELSNLWPRSESWQLYERRSGPLSHLFLAKRLFGRVKPA